MSDQQEKRFIRRGSGRMTRGLHLAPPSRQTTEVYTKGSAYEMGYYLIVGGVFTIFVLIAILAYLLTP